MSNQPFITPSELQEIFLKGFNKICGLNYKEEQETIRLAHILPIEMPLPMVTFMDEWVQAVELKLDSLNPDDDLWADWFSIRGYTYDEFRWVMETSISEEKISRVSVYNYLYIDDAIALEEFKIKYGNGEESLRMRYLKSLADSTAIEIPVMHQFLCITKQTIHYPIAAFKKHSYMVAQSSMGKSEFKKHLFNEFAQSEKSKKTLILLEPHMDLSIEVVALRTVWKYGVKKVAYLDPSICDTQSLLTGDQTDEASYAFSINPFDIPQESENTIPYLVEKLSMAFFSIINSDETFQMEALIEATVETLLKRPGSDITDLKRFMDDGQNEDLVEFAINNLEGERLDLMKNRFLQDNKIQTTKSSIYYRLQSLLGKKELLTCLAGKRTCDIQKLMNEGSIIICNFQKATLGPVGASLLGKIFIALVSGYATLRQKQKKSDRMDTYIFIDEFQNYINPGTTEEIFAEQRKYSTYFFVANQQMGQSMSPEIKRLIAGNTSLKLMGPNEPETLAWFSKQFKKLPEDAAFNLPPFSFWFYDKYNKKLGSCILRSPSHLVDTNNEHYLNKEELNTAFQYLKYKSGLYRKIEAVKRNDTNNNGPIDHNFID